MKSISILILLLLMIASCSDNSNKLIGVWYREYSENNYLNEKILIKSYIEYTDSQTMFSLMAINNKYYFSVFKSVPFDSIKVKYIDENCFYEDNDTLANRRITKDIKPHKYFVDLLYKNSTLTYSPQLTIDTVPDGSIYGNTKIVAESFDKIFQVEKNVKFFTDKFMSTLPKSERKDMWSRQEKRFYNSYEWENLDYRLKMECYFDTANKTDQYIYNDDDNLELRIWLDLK
jgi:hypothetical protein